MKGQNSVYGTIELHKCSDGKFIVGCDGVDSITSTGDGKIEFIRFKNHTLAFIKSSMGYPAYYPIPSVRIDKPILAVLMDLDGTSVHSESFWVWIIQKTIASLIDKPNFKLEETDIPYVSGHSVSEHLQYCIKRYCADKDVETARKYYFQHTRYEMNEIMQGRGRPNAFEPAPGLKDFLYSLKSQNIRVGLVTSGLYEKAWPEILSAFRTLNMGDPKDFYDCVITAGYPLQKGEAGTLGELTPKPHPWLYAEAARVGLGLDATKYHHIIGIEDSAAGICSIRLAGFSAIGIAGGNIIKSNVKNLCNHYCANFEDVLTIIDGGK